jgi:secreted Zn-dependent insulinase-like peptidase
MLRVIVLFLIQINKNYETNQQSSIGCNAILAVFAQQMDYSKAIPFDSTVKTGKLENGLTYYIKKNAKPEKKVDLRLVVNAGSILETDDQQGLAHFMEHMCFNGTKRFPKPIGRLFTKYWC